MGLKGITERDIHVYDGMLFFWMGV